MTTIANNNISINKLTIDEEKYGVENTPTKFDMYTFEPMSYEEFEEDPYEEMQAPYEMDEHCDCCAYCVCDISDSEFDIEYEGPLKLKDAY